MKTNQIAVHVLEGHSRPVIFEIGADRKIIVTLERETEIGIEFEKTDLWNSADLAVWAKQREIILPGSFLDQVHGAMAGRGPLHATPGQSVWYPTFDDIWDLVGAVYSLRIKQTAEGEVTLVKNFSTVFEVLEYLPKDKALRNRNANFTLEIGSLLLFDSQMIDVREGQQSQIGFQLAKCGTPLFNQLVAVEATNLHLGLGLIKRAR